MVSEDEKEIEKQEEYEYRFQENAGDRVLGHSREIEEVWMRRRMRRIEKPNFDKEDELLGLPKGWESVGSGDGFLSAREKILKLKKSDGDYEEKEEEEDEVDKEGSRESE
ncbi:hypothetical protein M0R45_019447 [Rubus argutus]|uniref:Uncharacterized protein n=1 Tax=Rubus argutus TaxID=59490 RepID=A0AAW1X715_RUBAR